jgi:peptide/nickel transport system permease protein
LSPFSPSRQDLTNIDQGPSWRHLLGTDSLGRDVLSRLLYGGRPALLGVAEGTVVFAVVGISLGVLSGYFGGWLDRVVSWLGDWVLTLPSIIVVLAMLAVFPSDMSMAMVTFGLLGSAGLTRVVRSTALQTREELYVVAARLGGVSRRRIVLRHMLPPAVATAAVQVFLFAGVMLLMQSGLAFIGVGMSPLQPSWGGMVADAASVIAQDKWALLPSGGLIALMTLAFGLLADAARDMASGPPSARTWTGMPGVHHLPGRADPANAPRVSGALLELIGVTIAYPDRKGDLVPVVTDVSCEVDIGEVVGVLGESGCGKSTVALAIMGLLAGGGTVVSGSIVFDGQRLTEFDEKTYARLRGTGIGFISQDPIGSLDPNFRVGSLLREAVRAHQRISSVKARQRALELLEMVRISDPDRVVRCYAHELSGGMAQRVAIAVALASDPKLLIADEPTTALDPTVQAEIMTLFQTLRTEKCLAILLVSHDWGIVYQNCSKAIVMYAGQIVEQAPTVELVTRPNHPYTKALLESNPQLVTKGRPLPVIAGTVPPPSAWTEGCRFAERCQYALPACTAHAVPLVRISDNRNVRCIRSVELREIEPDVITSLLPGD